MFNNNNNNNNHFTRTLSVLTSARVFMRRQPIPPLCGGAVQALPNIQTTLRDHPHPASRPMTFGHFTSWHADDRGYYTGAWVRRRRRRGWIFRFFGWESRTFSYVFLTSHLEIVEITVCLEGFRHARAAAAAMCTLCHFLQWILEIWLC